MQNITELANGSGEEAVRLVSNIYGHGGHLEFRIMAFLAGSCMTIILMLNMKFDQN